jgi:hypothetical protein
MNAAFPNALKWHTRSVQPPGIVSAALTPKLGRVGLLAASRQAAFAEKTTTTASGAARESLMAVSSVSGESTSVSSLDTSFEGKRATFL